jgi:GST-like protein
MGSPNVLKVRIMLEESGLPWRFTHVNVFGQGQFAPAFTAMNPNAKVPVIVDHDGPGGQPYTLFESGAILLYLAEKSGKFLPKDTAGRFDAIKWLMLQMASVGPMLGQLNHFQRTAPPSAEYGLTRYRNEARRLYDLLDRRLGESAYIAGDDYTIADMAVFPWALYQEIHGFDTAERPNLGRWAAAIGARPAVVRAQGEYADTQATDRDYRARATPEDIDRFYNRATSR